jgi:hypothetical protein
LCTCVYGFDFGQRFGEKALRSKRDKKWFVRTWYPEQFQAIRAISSRPVGREAAVVLPRWLPSLWREQDPLMQKADACERRA